MRLFLGVSLVLILVPSAAAQEHRGQAFRFGGVSDAPGHRMKVVRLQSLATGAATQLVIPNTEQNSPKASPKQEILDKVSGLQPGQIVRVEAEKWNGVPAIRSIELVDVKPGEESPRGFVFAEAYKDLKTHQQLVKLTKYGEPVIVTLPGTKDVPDPTVMDQVAKLKEGDVVYAQLNPGRTPQLASIYPYQPPQTGKVQKVEEQEVDGQKVTAVLIDADGKTVTALVPGKTVNKRWQPDPQIQRQAKSLRPGNDVEFITHDESDKTWLVDVQKVRPAPKESTRDRNRK